MYNKAPQFTKKKIIELTILVVVLLWFILLGVNYLRYTNDQPLILSISHTYDEEYPDGTVTEYVSLGYVYRKYNTASISRTEFVPFWVLREPAQVKADIPKALTGYNVPENPKHHKKHMGLLYFYDRASRNLLGTYKCINSEQNCDIATTGWDRFDIVNKDPLTKHDPYSFGDIHEKFAFIDDSPDQKIKYGEKSYVRNIYLYKFDKNNPEILAKFSDIKETSYNDIYNLANYDDYTYIVKDYKTSKWGIIKITSAGNIEVLLPYEYESITYDYDTKLYIVCKDNIWYGYDLNNKKAATVESVEVIYDIWQNANKTYYFKTGNETVVANNTYLNYSIYRADGVQFLRGDRITAIIPRTQYIMYVTAADNKLHFLTYSNREPYSLQLAFYQLDHDEFTHPAFEIMSESEVSIAIKVFYGRELKHDYDVKTVFTQHWEYNEED